MVNLKLHHLTVDNKTVSPIDKFEVWFQTPFGLVSTYEAAKEVCKTNDWDPDLMLAPVPVAIAINGTFEIVLRR